VVDTAPLTGADRQRLEKAARMAHQDYLRSAAPKEASFQPWDALEEALKLSNYYQVAYWERVLSDTVWVSGRWPSET